MLAVLLLSACLARKPGAKCEHGFFNRRYLDGEGSMSPIGARY